MARISTDDQALADFAGFSFWIMKICATSLGETAGDLLSMTVDVGYTEF